MMTFLPWSPHEDAGAGGGGGGGDRDKFQAPKGKLPKQSMEQIDASCDGGA